MEGVANQYENCIRTEPAEESRAAGPGGAVGRMKTIPTLEYISVLRQLVEAGRQVSIVISGGSMAPFLVHQRDRVFFEKPRRELRPGMIVFYQRDNGQYVLHRIHDIKSDGYYLLGDAQYLVEGPIRREQIFAVVTEAERKGRHIVPGSFWWEFFEHVWPRLLPLRRLQIRRRQQ